METSVWLPLQALGTMAIVIGLAWWSYKKTRKKLDDPRDTTHSALARDEPDPKFHADAEETDPFHVTAAHAEEPDHRADAEPRDVGETKPADRKTAGTSQDR